jgi:autotransporter-associated beta strand protein
MKTLLQQVFILAVLGVAQAVAQTVTWSGVASSEFSDSANWSLFPTSTSDAVFGTSTRTTVNVNGAQMLGSLSFTGSFPSYTFTGTNSGRLSVGPGGITTYANTSTVLFDATIGLDLMTAQTWTLDSDTTVRGVISGGTANSTLLTKAGAKTLTLAGANTYAGDTTISGGTLVAINTSGSATGTGKVTINSGATLQIGSRDNTGWVTGDILNNGSLVFNRADLLTRLSSGILATFKQDSLISGTGNITVNQGVVALTGANTYSGDTTVLSGRLIALNASGSATGTGNVILASDASLFEFGRGTAYGTISGNIQMNAGRATVLFARSDNFQYNGVISGLGGIQFAGTGVTTWGGLNTYQGQTYVGTGILSDGVAGAFSPNSRILINTGASLLVNFNETIPALTQNAIGFSIAPTDAMGAVTISSGATLTFNSPAGSDETFGGAIGGGGALAKTGSGTQRLGGASTYTGGTSINGGVLLVTSSSTRDATGAITAGPLGLGLVKLGDGVRFGLGGPSARIDNALSVGTNVTLLGGKQGDAVFELGGTVAFTNAATLLHVKGETPVLLWGALSGPAGTALTVDGGSSLVLLGSTGANITSMTADAAGLTFESAAALPSTLTVNALNGGYVSVAATNDANSPTPALLLSRIATPAAFQGTFGFDSDPGYNVIHTYADNLDFSAFTNAAFRIGSGTAAILAGTITPPVVNGAPLYAFGGVGGHLGITSALTNVGAAPAAVTVSSATGFDPMMVIFRGANTYTGTLSAGAATANLVVDNGLAVLDGSGALPAGAKFAFGTNGPGYVSATEASGFTSFADFASRVAGYNANSILGIDSHAFFDFKIANGAEAKPGPIGTFGGAIDLRTFSSIYLGTATNMILSGAITAPADGVLRLTTVDGGHLTVATTLGSGINSVVIGLPGPAEDEFADGAVRLTGANSYAGGTTLLSGTLELDSGSSYPGAGTPLGTGPLTVGSGGVSTPVLRGTSGTSGSTSGSTNLPVVLNGRLQVNDWSPANSDPLSATAGSFSFGGPISGPGSLEIYGKSSFNNNYRSPYTNTYSGGTILHPGSLAGLGINGAFGTGPLTLEGPTMVFYYNAGDLVIANPVILSGEFQHAANGVLLMSGPITLQRDASLKFKWGALDRPSQLTGAISGPGSLTFAPQWSPAIYQLSGTNTYTGGTNAAGAVVVFMNESALPTSGTLMTSQPSGFSDAGYIGAAFTTNTRAFLDRFDRERAFGVIGFDSPDPSAPNVFTSDIDLTGFNPYVWLGSASAAILSGTITPQGNMYQFGDGGGTLTVTSALTGARSVVADSTTRPLTLVLKGTNTYSGTTEASNSVIRLASVGALPASSTLIAQNGYIGMTESVGLTLDAFIRRFSAATNSIIGLDADDLVAGRVITDPISLAAYSTIPTAFIGTSTKLTLNGALTPFGTELRLAAAGTGSLVVNSPITTGSVLIGTGGSIGTNATVTLNGASTYTGGTTVNNTHLLVGDAAALGTGPVTIKGNSWFGANVAGLTIANTMTGTSGVAIDGTNSLTLSGALTLNQLRKTGPGALTLSAHNANLTGTVVLEAGSLILTQDDALGAAALSLSEGTLADFRTAAPVVTSIYGGSVSGSSVAPAQIRLADASTLTLTGLTSTGASITGNGAVVIANAAANNANAAWFYGNNTYTGGTTIQNGAVLKVSSDGALGTTGNVTLNGGTLGIYASANVRFSAASSHALVFNSGRIFGAGTLTSDASLIIGAARTLAPGSAVGVGSPSTDLIVPARLSLTFSGGSKLVFDSGGTCEFRLSDASQPQNGWSQIAVAGPLDITATAAAPFQITLASVNYSNGTPGIGIAQGFNPGLAYSWTLLKATTITGFDAAKFTVDASGFLNMPVNAGFTIGVDDLTTPTSLLLNYNPSAVPEPSTWALLLTGLATVGWAFGRRRR